MSALKEEWANLMKLRGSGRVEENKAEDVKNRIFQNFQHMLKGHTTDLPKEFNKAQVKPEFEALRTKVQSVFHGIVERDKDNKAKDIAKQFVFGLNSQRSKTPVPTTIRARKESQEVPGTIDEIWKSEDSAMKMPENELLQPKFELLSLANKSMQNKHAELADREISIFQDLSPAARFMSNLTDEEEEMLMTGINKSELHAQAHLLQIDISKINIDKIEWNDASALVLGRIPKKTLLKRLKNMPDSPDQSVHNSHMTLEDLSYANKTIADTNNQHLQRSAIQVTDKKNTTMPIMYINENNKREDEDLETQLEDMMEIIRSQQEGDINDIDEKLQQLLEYMNTKIRNNPQNPKILEFMMIFQFLTEYKKARDLKVPKKTAKPAVPKVKRYPKAKHSPPRPAQSAYYYSPKASETTTTVMNQGWSTSSKPSVLNARYAPIKRQSAKLNDSPTSYKSKESGKKHSFHNNTASSSSKIKSKPSSPPQAEKWIGGSRQSNEYEDEGVWVNANKAVKKSNLKSLDQFVDYDVMESNDLFRNDRR